MDHARFVRKYLADDGMDVAAIYSEPDSDDRDASLRALASGELDAVCAVDILNEGIDIPRIDRVVMLRPTESPVVFMQQLGRGLRRAEDKDHLIAELRARQIEPRGSNVIPFPRPGHVIAFPTIEAAAGESSTPMPRDFDSPRKA